MTSKRTTFYTLILLLLVGILLLSFYSLTKHTQEKIVESNTDNSTQELESNVSSSTEITETVKNEESETQTIASTTNNSSKSAPKIPEAKNTEPVVKTEAITQSVDSLKILAAHNAARKEVNVEPLTYSKTLAQSAQKWSEELQRNNCEMRHDPNTEYGENLYWASQTGGATGNKLIMTPEAVVNFWVDEKTDYNYNENSCESGKQCGHYTQIVWEETSEVGCGVSICQSENNQKEIWVCRYNPPGNYFDERPY